MTGSDDILGKKANKDEPREETKWGLDEKNRLIKEFTTIITKCADSIAAKRKATTVDDGDYKRLTFKVVDKRNLGWIITSKVGIGIGGVSIATGVGLYPFIDFGWFLVLMGGGVVFMVIGFCTGYPG
jgi:hypothetical protein